MFNGEIIKYVVLLQVKGLVVKFRTKKKKKKKKKKKNGAHFYRPPVILLRGTQNTAIEHQVLCSNTLKKNKLKIYISLKENKLASFINS